MRDLESLSAKVHEAMAALFDQGRDSQRSG
jgi:hypothetical protein